VRRFEIRRGSGGAGRWRGGDGVIREIGFLEPAQLSFVSQHRATPAYAGEGGEAGVAGAQRIIRADGTLHALAGVDEASMAPGDRVIIETPGGGGFGAPARDVEVR